MFDAKKLEKQDSLPFPPTPSGSVAGRTLQESTIRPGDAASASRDSPNIVIVLIDDAGPGLPTTFGGEVTATMDRIGEEGFATTGFTPPRCVRRRGRRC